MCYFERILNIQPPFVVSVAVLMINIHKYKSRVVTLYLMKHRILIRGGFIDIKSLQMMYDRLFDRSINGLMNY